MLQQFRFLPVGLEDEVPLPDDWTFVVAMCGVHAAKASGARDQYNRLALETAELLAIVNQSQNRTDASLLSALHANGGDIQPLLRAVTEQRGVESPLVERMRQFVEESEQLVPDVVRYLRSSNITALGAAVDRSQALAETVLSNQVQETVDLVRRARSTGAIAASSFGAGFGGSVWALVRQSSAADFMGDWERWYHHTWPAAATASVFFSTRPGPSATALGVLP